jgi:hypothetical protein
MGVTSRERKEPLRAKRECQATIESIMDGRLEILLFIQNGGARPVMDVPREVIPSHARASRPRSPVSQPCDRPNRVAPFRRFQRPSTRRNRVLQPWRELPSGVPFMSDTVLRPCPSAQGSHTGHLGDCFAHSQEPAA